MAASDPCSAGFLSQLFAGNAIVCSATFKDYETSSATEQIESVADNASTFYGEGSPTAQIAAATAAQQAAHVTDDVQGVTEDIANSKIGQIFTTCDSGAEGLAIPGLPCISFKWIGIGLGGLLLLYVFLVINSFVPRPR